MIGLGTSGARSESNALFPILLISYSYDLALRSSQLVLEFLFCLLEEGSGNDDECTWSRIR